VFEVMSVFALMQHCNRSISEARTFLNLRTDCRTCRNNSLLHIFKVWALPDIQCFLMFIKKSSSVMSGERTGHEIGPPRFIHRLRKFH